MSRTVTQQSHSVSFKTHLADFTEASLCVNKGREACIFRTGAFLPEPTSLENFLPKIINRDCRHQPAAF